MIYNMNKFRHYLLGRKFTFHVNHSALLYLVLKQSLTGKLARWTLLLLESEFNIIHRLGVQHEVADNLSRQCRRSQVQEFGMIFPMPNYSESKH